MAREVEARLLVFEGLIILLSVVESCAVVQVCGRGRTLGGGKHNPSFASVVAPLFIMGLSLADSLIRG